jgi:hypothetical protein
VPLEDNAVKRWVGLFGVLAVVAVGMFVFRFRSPAGYFDRIQGGMTPEEVAVVMGRKSDREVTGKKSGHRIQTWVFPRWKKNIEVVVEYENDRIAEKRLEEVLMDAPYYVLLDKQSFSRRSVAVRVTGR